MGSSEARSQNTTESQTPVSLDTLMAPIDVKASKWVAEAALWMYWVHMGDFSACSEGALLSIGQDVFQEIITSQSTAHAAACDHAASFAIHMRLTSGTDIISDRAVGNLKAGINFFT